MNKSHPATPLRYHPFYCEENIWHLCQSPHIQPELAFVVIVSNSARQCRLLFQRVAPPGMPVLWDYHVFLIAHSSKREAWKVWDLDTVLPLPCPLRSYFNATYDHQEAFGTLSQQLRPMFRLVPATEYIQQFSSDRAHMKDAGGNYVKPPPPWPLIRPRGVPHTLRELLDISLAPPGATMDLSGVLERFDGLD